MIRQGHKNLIKNHPVAYCCCCCCCDVFLFFTQGFIFILSQSPFSVHVLCFFPIQKVQEYVRVLYVNAMECIVYFHSLHRNTKNKKKRPHIHRDRNTTKMELDSFYYTPLVLSFSTFRLPLHFYDMISCILMAC